MANLILKPDVESKLRNFYPWIYAHEVEAVEGEGAPGQVVEVKTARGDFVCRAFFNPNSHIPARVLTYEPKQKIDRAFFEDRMRAAAKLREGRVTHTNARRLIHAEADELPGLIVDRFADTLVIQIRNPGMEAYREEIVRGLKHVFAPTGIYERSDTQAREEEGLEPRAGLVWGQVPPKIELFEDDVHFQVSVEAGQKTGFYLDQRDNRRLLASLVTPDSRVLDVYAYTGAFSLHAARAGAQALAVDKDTEALQLLEANAQRNGLADKVGARWGDAVEVMDNLAREGRKFTHIILDPPTLAKHKNDVPRVKQLFTQITARALAMLDPGGILFLSTCAYHISVNDLIESARRGASEVHRRAQVLTITYQPADHPWMIQIPETLYLKTLVLRAE